MVLYIDVIILFNFILDYSLITYTGIIQKRRIKAFRLILASIFATSSITLFLLTNIILFSLLKILWSFLIILIAFKYENVRKYIGDVIVFYILSFCTAGILIALNGSDMNLLVNPYSSAKDISWILVVVGFILSNVLIYYFKIDGETSKIYENKVYHYRLKIVDNYYNGRGFMDSGNMVKIIGENIPVIFVNKRKICESITESFCKRLKIKYRFINYNTVDSFNTVLAFKPKCFEILVKGNYVKRDVYIVVTDNLKNGSNFDAILNLKLII